MKRKTVWHVVWNGARASLIFVLGFTANALTTNSWIDGSGKWENVANWSLGVAPSNNQSVVFITNALSKSVTIDAVTTNQTGVMTISNLTVFAPGGNVNTLRLTNAGTATPLHVLNGFNLGTNAALLVTNSAIQVDGLSGSTFTVDGSATNLAGSQVIATNLTIGSLANSRGNY